MPTHIVRAFAKFVRLRFSNPIPKTITFQLFTEKKKCANERLRGSFRNKNTIKLLEYELYLLKTQTHKHAHALRK